MEEMHVITPDVFSKCPNDADIVFVAVKRFLDKESSQSFNFSLKGGADLPLPILQINISNEPYFSTKFFIAFSD